VTSETWNTNTTQLMHNRNLQPQKQKRRTEARANARADLGMRAPIWQGLSLSLVLSAVLQLFQLPSIPIPRWFRVQKEGCALSWHAFSTPPSALEICTSLQLNLTISKHGSDQIVVACLPCHASLGKLSIAQVIKRNFILGGISHGLYANTNVPR